MLDYLFQSKVKINSLHFSYDSLTIHNGDSTSSPIIGTYCGTTIPPTRISSVNEVLVHFETDNGVTGNGFYLQHQQLSTSNFDLCTFSKFVECYVYTFVKFNVHQ